ncbi:predicted signal transduction protein [Vibrio maritimus]|uniref:Predicted signal transduction protein n=1 Tax=Vibrio maritimus TaxID=990268 RepID=A0A090T4K8_9VIBR|nr:predicted signal transduction protein [Vibrio maritimus]
MNASYLIRSEIKSFKQALVYLGEERLRKFISLVAITSTQDDKPDSSIACRFNALVSVSCC